MDQNNVNIEAEQGYFDLILARNAFLDAFSDLETAVTKVLRSCAIPPSNEPFGQRLEKFRKASGSPMIAKCNYPQRGKIADEIATFLQIRADIVHSRMQPAWIGDEAHGIFVNSQAACDRMPSTRIMSVTELQRQARRMSSISRQIADLGKPNPASSPPPPLPGAAGGP